MKGCVFRTCPPLELLDAVLASLKRPRTSFPCMISKEELDGYFWGEELVQLYPYYIPSMRERFFDPETALPFQTRSVLRHLLRAHGYDLVGKETMTNYVKSLTYQLVETKQKLSLDGEVVIEFT